MLSIVKLGQALQGLLLPPRCHICRKLMPPNDNGLHICQDCYSQLPLLISPLCSICGIPFDGVGQDHPCGNCIKQPPAYTAARAALCYQGELTRLIHNFKYNGKSYLRRPLGLLIAQLLADFAAEQQPDFLVPVPLHKTRLRSRGYNQSVLLADLLSQKWQIKLLRQGLVRIRATTPQMELGRKQRLVNLKDAFEVYDVSVIEGRRIMLVDDVFTTGSTLEACAKALMIAGASSVSAVTIAHAP